MTTKPRTTTEFLMDTYCATVLKLRAEGVPEAEIVREMKRLTERAETNG
ncbi:hypothetical protein [Roseinatronobacter sp.]